jgi:protein tyrosine kinase modulator
MIEESDEQGNRGIGDYWAMVVRRRWAILLPLFVCWLTVWCLSWLIPSSYKSEAQILVEQQKVPEQYVVRNVNVSLQDRLQSMTAQILSRTRLQATINRFHLYEGHRRFSMSDDPVEQMRKDIKIALVDSAERPGQLTSFKITYSAGSPGLAQEVNSELTSLFIDENLKFEQQMSESTNTFLQTQLTEARTKLEEQEAKVRAFKAAHFGDLPSESESNTTILSGLQSQLQESQRALDSAKQRRLYLESMQQEYQAAQSRVNADSGSSNGLQEINEELVSLRQKLEDARSRLTEEHPDVIALRDKIAKKEKLKKEMQAELSAHPDAAPRAPRAGETGAGDAGERTGAGSLIQVQSQLKAIRLEVENSEARVKDLESQISVYRGRLNMTPQTEQQLADVSRGYEESKANYNSLLAKQNQSQLATSLAQRQQGEQFRVLDSPSLPLKPAAPNHLLLSLGGLLGGLVLGLIIAAILEMMNVLVRQQSDIERIAQVRVLVGIPHITAAGEERQKFARHRMELSAVAAMGFLIVVGNLIAFYKS